MIGGKCYFTEGSLIFCLSGSMLTVLLPLASTALQREPLVPQGCSQLTQAAAQQQTACLQTTARGLSLTAGLLARGMLTALTMVSAV